MPRSDLAAPTPAAIRDTAICAAMWALTKHLPEDARGHRAFFSGDLVLGAWRDPGADEIVLDAWLSNTGKVASFRVSSDGGSVQRVSLKVHVLPRWLPILQFEAAALAVGGFNA